MKKDIRLSDIDISTAIPNAFLRFSGIVLLVHSIIIAGDIFVISNSYTYIVGAYLVIFSVIAVILGI